MKGRGRVSPAEGSVGQRPGSNNVLEWLKWGERLKRPVPHALGPPCLLPSPAAPSSRKPAASLGKAASALFATRGQQRTHLGRSGEAEG